MSSPFYLNSASLTARKSLLIILAVFIVSILVNAYILNKSQLIREGDEAGRINEAILLQQALSGEIKIAPGSLFKILASSSLHPKLYSTAEGVILTILAKLDLKDIELMIQITNSIFLLILLMSIYGLGLLIYSRKVGLLAAALLPFSPIIFSYTRLSMIELSLTALISLSFLCLLKSDNFKSTFYSIITGILFGMSVLAKETAILFILAPFLYYVFKSFRIGTGRKMFANFIATVFLPVAMGGLFYLNPKDKNMFSRFWDIAAFSKFHEKDPLFYLTCFKDYYLGPLLLLTALPLLLSYVSNLKRRDTFLALWLVCSIPFFSISPSRVARLIMPILPALFLILSAEIFIPFFAKVKKWYVAILIAATIFQYSVINFSPAFALSFFHSTLYGRNHYIHVGGLLTAFRNKEAPSERRLFHFFDSNRLLVGRESRILFIFNSHISDVLNYEFHMEKIHFQAMKLHECLQLKKECLPCQSVEKWMKYFLSATYIVDRTDSSGKHPDLVGVPKECRQALTKAMFYFKKVGTLEAWDGGKLTIFQKIKRGKILP
jgi:hypothetical protein